MNIEAIVFDADGTILDTRELIYEAYRHVLSSHGYPTPPREELARFGGAPSEDYYRHFAKDHDASELYEKHRLFQMDHLDLFEAYEGLEDLMEKLKRAGLRLGICTNRAESVVALLQKLGIKEHFDGIMHADLMTNTKPHPEGLLTLCRDMGIAPSASVMVGDTETDIETANAAGCAFSVGVTHGFRSRPFLIEAGAEFVVDHLREILALPPIQDRLAADVHG